MQPSSPCLMGRRTTQFLGMLLSRVQSRHLSRIRLGLGTQTTPPKKHAGLCRPVGQYFDVLSAPLSIFTLMT
jgi:hypothetical protein